ncbi:MAG: COX15/CtaA family protein, partial [Alphaproteobacteria bacterium]
MSRAEFKTIVWWEFVHRLWGRLIGVVFLLPFLWFLLHGRIAWRLAPRLALLFVLGGAQGALGWYMVKSGLVDQPDVSQYRLTAHLSLALLIFAALLWFAMALTLSPPPAIADRRLDTVRRLANATL